jgi:hypothetical protein
VLAAGFLVGRIMKVTAAPQDAPWMWSLAYGQHRDRSPTMATSHADSFHGLECALFHTVIHRTAAALNHRDDREWPEIQTSPSELDCRRGTVTHRYQRR